MKIITKTLSIVAIISLMHTIASADVAKGQKIYLKKMKASCGISGLNFARKHTQDQWENIYESGQFKKEVSKICPKSKMKPKYEKDIYDFSYEYALDSGKTPSC